MGTLKFYFQSTIETITLVAILSAAIFTVDFVVEFVSRDENLKRRGPMNLKPQPGTEDFARFKRPFKEGSLISHHEMMKLLKGQQK